MADKPQYKSVAAAWLGESDNGEYIMIKAEEDFTVKAGEKFYMNKNQYKTEDKHPDYVKRVKVEEEQKPF